MENKYIIFKNYRKIIIIIFIVFITLFILSELVDFWIISENKDVPVLTKEEAYNLLKNLNVDADGNLEIDENLYKKNEALFNEIQKEIDEEYDEYISQFEKKDKPIKKKW